MIQIAQNYLKKHGYEKYSVIDDVSVLYDGKGIVMYEVEFPQRVYLEVMQTTMKWL